MNGRAVSRLRWNVPARPIVGINVSERAQFGALVQLTAKPGSRDELVRVLGNYARTLDDGEPGTTLYTVAADPNDDDLVWMWEEFADGEAVQAVSSSIAADRESLKQPQLFRRVAKLLGAPESFLPRRPLRLIAGQANRRPTKCTPVPD